MDSELQAVSKKARLKQKYGDAETAGQPYVVTSLAGLVAGSNASCFWRLLWNAAEQIRAGSQHSLFLNKCALSQKGLWASEPCLLHVTTVTTSPRH